MLEIGERFNVLGLPESLALASLLHPVRIPVVLRHAILGVSVSVCCVPLKLENKGGDTATFGGRIVVEGVGKKGTQYCFLGIWNAGTGYKEVRITAMVSAEEMKDESDDALVV